MTGKWGQHVACAVGLLLVLSAAAFAQGARRGEVSGSIKDDTGAALPGVSVTVTSPALQVPQVVGVSDERGEYRVIDLPPGTFRVQYELAGFGTLVREGIVLTSGFVAKVDVVLKVATLSETVTVSGESPVVDVTTTRGGTTVSSELIETIPGNNNYRDVMLMVGGMQPNNAPLTGGESAQALGFNGVAYGSGVGSANVEGMRMMNFQPANFSAYQEVDVKTFGNTADVDQPGANVQLVVKSGGNQFHGRYNNIYQSDNFASDNIDDRLRAQGVTKGDSVVFFNDFTADLGGRIIRDKLWFYGSFRESRTKVTSFGFVTGPGPDGVFQTGDEPTAFPKDRTRGGVGKLSYQMNAQNRFVFLWHENNDHYAAYYTRFSPLESSAVQNQLGREVKPIEWSGTLTNRWVANMFYGRSRFAAYRYPTVPFAKGTPSTNDLTTQQNTGPVFNNNYPGASYLPRQQFSGSLSYLPARTMLGSHSFQGGYRMMLADYDKVFPGGGPESDCKPGFEVCPALTGFGEYQLIFDTINNVPHSGTQINVKTFPVKGSSAEDQYSAYLMDSWRPTNRLTLNLGVRWERNHYWVPASTRAPSTPFGFVEAIGTDLPTSFSKFDVNDWKGFLPRFGVAYDISGDGRTVVKGTYGQFYADLQANSYADGFTPSSVLTYSYRWADRNNDKLYQPGEVNLSTSGLDFLSVSGGTTQIPNPDLKLTRTDEASGSLERQLGQGFAIRGLYVYKRVVNNFQTANILRPPSVWDQRFQRADPGPDGVLGNGDDGPMLTIFDYNPAYRGAAFVKNMNVNADPDRNDSYKSIEVQLTKRPSGRWYANTSILATYNHVFRCQNVATSCARTVTTPNDNLFPDGKFWDVTYLLAGGYNLPKGFLISSLTQMYNGLARQRVNIFRAADPAGGARFPSSNQLQLPVESQGDTKAPKRIISNIRFGKDVRLADQRKLTFSVDGFNMFNSNVAWGATNSQNGFGVIGLSDVSGPTYNNTLTIVQPRMFRFNVGFEF
jgi:hypothetical protein